MKNGFKIRYQGHNGKQMLSYHWDGDDGKPLMLEYAVGGWGHNGDAEIIAVELEHLAEAIREKNKAHRVKQNNKK